MSICLLALTVTSPVLAQTVVLDPGHGGGDGGATYCGIEEADVVLDVAQRAARMLRAAGLTVHMTRTDDRFIELTDRSSFANARGADRFVSIHSNANAGTPATGTETFVYTSASTASRDMGGRIQTQMVATWGLRDRGLKSANFSVIRRTSMPGALAELAFTNNCGVDARLLASASERERIAAAISRGVLGNLGRSGPADPGPGDPAPTEPPPATGGRLIGVAYVDRGAGAEDTSERVGGASARIRETGTTRTANASGTFDFALPPGTYTVEVSESGFVTGTRSCVVSTGDAWCSVGLRPAAAAASGRAVGVVFEDLGAGFADTSGRLSGARVRVVDTGATATTDGSGNWSLGLPNGTYTLEVTRSGYVTTRRSCEVAGPESWCSVGIARTVAAGTLQGVVYRQGSLSTRLVGATVRIVENGAMTTSASGSGFWSLELAPGSYTVEVGGAGSLTTTRRCDVTTGGETWCSVGLPRAGGGGGALEEVVDERPAEEAAFDREDGLTVSGCSASGSTGGSPWLLVPFMFLFAGLRRRDARRSAWIATAMMAVVSVAVGCSEGDSPRGVSAAVTQTQDEELALAREVDSFASATGERVIARGDYVDLALSPDGTRLALSHARFAGLSVMPTAGGDAQVLASTERSGYAPVWRADGRALGLRVAGQTDTAVPILALALDGQEVAPVRASSPVRVRVTDEGAIVLRTSDGDETTLAPPGDTYFSPSVSPDARHVAFRGLSTGLYVYRVADGATFMVGPGAHARFAGQRWMVFERTEDDGHAVQSAELYLMDLDSETLDFGVIATSEGLAEAGTIAGDVLAFLRGDQVITGRLQIRR